MHEAGQPKVLAIKRLYTISWLVDNTIDVSLYNNLDLMTEYHKKPTQIGNSKSYVISLRRGKI